MLLFEVDKRKEKSRKQKLRVYIFGRDLQRKIEDYKNRNWAPTNFRYQVTIFVDINLPKNETFLNSVCLRSKKL